ncbi:MAG: S-layer homology domain-containing protein [Oscillospiraceae bacterium]
MKKKALSLLLVLAMALSIGTSVLAAGRFTDVPANHWATSYINALADGGLISGYGGGKFGPDDQFHIDQMATIIANAKGYESGAKDTYWGYGAVDYCINVAHCLPMFDTAITSKNFSVPCSRELATYMLMKGLGPKDLDNRKTVKYTDIPDYGDIEQIYRDTILEAYCYGLTEGVDKAHTFMPKKGLTRAEATTIFYRAGYTTAAEKPMSTTSLTNDQIMAQIKALGIWDTKTMYDDETGAFMKAKDLKYGGLNIYQTDRGNISIYLPEQNVRAMFDPTGNFYINAHTGAKMNDYLDKNGVFVCSTGFGYTARRLLLDILKIIYPTKYQQAYEAVKATMLEEIYERGATEYASALRWYDGRKFGVSMTGSNVLAIDIGNPNDVAGYHEVKAIVPSGTHQVFPYFIGANETAFKAYQYDKW